MATPARGTGLSVAKSGYYGKKYLAPTADAVMWGAGILAAPEVTAVAYWYEKGGGKEYLDEKGKQIGKKIAEVQNWVDERKRQKELIGIKPAGMKLGALGMESTAGKTITGGAATMLAVSRSEQSWRAANKASSLGREEVRVGMKHLDAAGKAANSARTLEKSYPEIAMEAIRQGNGHMDRAEAASLRAGEYFKAAKMERRVASGYGAIGIGMGIVTGLSVGYDVVKAGSAARAAARKPASTDRY